MKKIVIGLLCSSALISSSSYALNTDFSARNFSAESVSEQKVLTSDLPEVFSSVNLTKKQKNELTNLFAQTQSYRDQYAGDIEKNQKKIKSYIQKGNSSSANKLIAEQYKVYEKLGLVSALEKNKVYNILKPNQRNKFIKALEKQNPNCCSTKPNKKKPKNSNKVKNNKQAMPLGVYSGLGLSESKIAQLNKLRKSRKQDQDKYYKQLADISPHLMKEIDAKGDNKKAIEKLIKKKYKILTSLAQSNAKTQAKIYKMLDAKQKKKLIDKFENTSYKKIREKSS